MTLCEVVFVGRKLRFIMDVRMQEFMDKINYVNWMWHLRQIGVPMQITFETDAQWDGNSFCGACMGLFDITYGMYGVQMQSENKCTVFVARKDLEVELMPNESVLSFTGDRYDKTFTYLKEAADDVREYLEGVLEERRAEGIHVGKIVCNFAAVLNSINGILTQRFYTSFADYTALAWLHGHALSVSFDSADLKSYGVPVYDIKTECYRMIKPDVQMVFTPQSTMTPALGTCTVRIENTICKEPNIAKNLRVAIYDTVKAGAEFHNLDIENTFIYLADCNVS